MSSGCSAETFISALQQAWSFTTQSTSPERTFSYRCSTSAQALVGGFTLALGPGKRPGSARMG